MTRAFRDGHSASSMWKHIALDRSMGSTVTFPIVCPRLEARFVRKSPRSRSIRRRQKHELSSLWRHSMSQSASWTLTMSKSYKTMAQVPQFGSHIICSPDQQEQALLQLGTGQIEEYRRGDSRSFPAGYALCIVSSSCLNRYFYLRKRLSCLR